MAYRLKDHQARIDRLEQRLLAEISRDKHETTAELSARLGAEYSFVCAALRQVRSRSDDSVSYIIVPSVGKGRPKLAYKLTTPVS